MSDQNETPDLKIARMRSIQPVTMFFKRHKRRMERFRRPSQVSRSKRDLGFGNDAPCARHGFFRTEGPRRASQQFLRPRELAQLRHRDPAKRQCRSIVAQRNPLQRPQRIARGKRLSRGCYQRIHRNPVTLVTPTLGSAWAKYLVDGKEPVPPNQEKEIIMNIEKKTVLITGTNRGIGSALVQEALRRGAKRVYAGTRGALDIADPRVVPVAIDVTNDTQIERAVRQVGSLDVLINNSGIAPYDDLSDPAVIEQTLAVNFFGMYKVSRSFLPMLKLSKGAIVNNLSLMALAPLPPRPAMPFRRRQR